jgi:hypothetical protein
MFFTKHFKMLDISNGHMTQEDCNLLENEGCGGSDKLCFSCTKYEEGFYINLSGIELPHVKQDLAKFSSAFEHILRVAKEEGFDFINFDRDGEVYPDLPTFDW